MNNFSKVLTRKWKEKKKKKKHLLVNFHLGIKEGVLFDGGV